MKTHTLASSHDVPLLGLGTWEAGPGEVRAAVTEAIRIGYRHIDCAPIYGNERAVGQAIAACIEKGVVSRDDLFITSKLWNDAHEAGAVRPALEKTLSDLGLERLDLFLMHWPVALRPGAGLPRTAADLITPEELPLAVTWAAMEATVEAGLVSDIGVSNFSVLKLRALADGARIRPAVNQVEMHPYLQQPELLAYCRENGILLTAYSPLGSKGRPEMFKAADEPVLLEDRVVQEVAERAGVTSAQVLIAWAIERGTAVIPKSTNPGRMRENLAAADVQLEADAMRSLSQLDRAHRYVSGAFWVVDDGPHTLANLWDE